MEDSSMQKLQELGVKLDAIFKSVEKTRRYFQITMWITLFFLILPLIITVFVVPLFFNSYVGSLSDDSSSSGAANQSQFNALKDLLQ